MSSNHTIVPRYEGFGGLDLRSTELVRSPVSFSYLKNVDVLRTGSLVVRRGSKVVCPSIGGIGKAKYSRQSTTDGSATVEILPIGSKLYKRNTGTVALTYSGAATSVSCSILGDDTSIKLYLIEDGTTTQTIDLGIGYDTGSPTTLANLETAIDALASYEMTVTGDSSVPAAFLPVLFQEPFNSGSLSISYCYDTQVNQPASASDPFTNSQSNRNASNFQNVSWVNKDNVIYFGTPWDEMQKYDGQKVYRAGLPTPTAAPGLTNAGAGSVNTGVHQVFYTYYQKDKQNNEVESNASAVASITLAGASIITVAPNNIQNSTGFNTDQAIVNGNQVGVTTVNTNSHSLKVGDVAYFLDRATSTYVEKTITGVTATSIAFVGAVNVNNNDVISANLRIRIWATAAGGQSYYLVDEIPNASNTATQNYSYNITDTVLLTKSVWTPPIVSHDPPPKGAFVTTHQGLLVVAGIFAEPNTVYYSDEASGEYFDSRLAFDCETIDNDIITGIAPSNEFLVAFKKRSYFLVSGILATAQYRVDQVSYHIGCVSHHTIADIEGSTTFLSEDGPYQITAGGVAVSIGEQIYPLFSTLIPISDYRLKLSRAVAVDDKLNQKYLLFIPAESTSGGSIYANDYSTLLAWDYTPSGTKSWWPWTGMDFSGGAVVDGSDLYWCERRLSSALSTITNLHHKRGTRGDLYDYADHHQAIEWIATTGWDSLGAPSIYKKYLRIKAYATDPNIAAGYTLRIQTERSYIAGVIDTDLSLVFGSGSGSGYSFTPYGSMYGDPSNPARPQKLKANKALSLRFTFSHNTIYVIPILTGWELEIATPYGEVIKD